MIFILVFLKNGEQQLKSLCSGINGVHQNDDDQNPV
jgi:hypothetical protein